MSAAAGAPSVAMSSPPVSPSGSYSTIVSHIRSVNRKIEAALLEKTPWFTFPTDSTDGRTNSLIGEGLVSDYLLNYPGLKDLLVKKPSKKSAKKDCEDEDNRALGDIGINLEMFGIHEPSPCNIKIISETNTAGNNSCGLINLIGHTFSKPCHTHPEAMKVLIEVDRSGYETLLPQLYGLIMVQKESQKCWVGTFDEVPDKSIGTSPSNPLQVPFLYERVERTPKEYIEMIIRKVVDYHTKKSTPLSLWMEYTTKKSE